MCSCWDGFLGGVGDEYVSEMVRERMWSVEDRKRRCWVEVGEVWFLGMRVCK